MVVGGGFEPPKAPPSDLQSDPFDHSGTPPHFFGADTPNRTEDILITSEMLCQLSYIGSFKTMTLFLAAIEKPKKHNKKI